MEKAGNDLAALVGRLGAVAAGIALVYGTAAVWPSSAHSARPAQISQPAAKAVDPIEWNTYLAAAEGPFWVTYCAMGHVPSPDPPKPDVKPPKPDEPPVPLPSLPIEPAAPAMVEPTQTTPAPPQSPPAGVIPPTRPTPPAVSPDPPGPPLPRTPPAVLVVPQDGHNWRLLVVWGADRKTDPRQITLEANFNSNTQLRSFALACKPPRSITPENTDEWPLYLRQLGGRMPQLWIYREGDEQAAVSLAGDEIPDDPEALVKLLAEGLKDAKPFTERAKSRARAEQPTIRRTIREMPFQLPLVNIGSAGAGCSGGG